MSAYLICWPNTAGLLPLLNSPTVFADAKLPRLMGNRIVLQGGHALTVQGWADQGLKGMNGVVWSRREIDIYPPVMRQSVRLRLSNVVDQDSATRCDEDQLPASVFGAAQTA